MRIQPPSTRRLMAWVVLLALNLAALRTMDWHDESIAIVMPFAVIWQVGLFRWRRTPSGRPLRTMLGAFLIVGFLSLLSLVQTLALGNHPRAPMDPILRVRFFIGDAWTQFIEFVYPLWIRPVLARSYADRTNIAAAIWLDVVVALVYLLPHLVPSVTAALLAGLVHRCTTPARSAPPS